MKMCAVVLQADSQIREQLFKLYHIERHIEELTAGMRTRQKEIDKLVSAV